MPAWQNLHQRKLKEDTCFEVYAKNMSVYTHFLWKYPINYFFESLRRCLGSKTGARNDVSFVKIFTQVESLSDRLFMSNKNISGPSIDLSEGIVRRRLFYFIPMLFHFIYVCILNGHVIWSNNSFEEKGQRFILRINFLVHTPEVYGYQH